MPCSGAILTSFTRSERKLDMDHEICGCYRKYTKWSPLPSGLKGRQWPLENLSFVTFADYEFENRVRYVRIYFDTPTYDKITKDRAAKFVDMLSAIGGTMGLLTGFSIISAVELVYFAVKFMYDTLKRKNLKDYFK